ncbi:MAG: glycosyltransferase family 25 protein [Pseudomonadota bacterium]|nr:glycosyltransferase family 25 protein [Pseudomonadota bacterium]MEC8568852.1 glycosyltransferase family 25 protein [Pseudomonadota bacterium]
MKNFVISLATATDRRVHIQQQFSAQNIQFEFFDAITPEPARQWAQQLGISIQNADLTQGEIACLMSHVCLWQKIVDENLAYAAIFEDDVFLAENASQYLSDACWLQAIDNAYIIKIEAFAKKAFMSMKRTNIGRDGRSLCILTGMHLGCAGYILSRQAAESLLNFIRHYSPVIAVDHVVFEDYVQAGEYPVYQMNSALCMQSDIFLPKDRSFESSLEKDRRQRFDAKLKKNKASLSFSMKVKREFFRVFLQMHAAIKNFLFFRKIFFNANSRSE